MIARAGRRLGGDGFELRQSSTSTQTFSLKQKLMHQDLTVGVMSGLAWYYLLAAMMNAAAAAYVSYGEMVSEGASRVGLAPKTRRLPPWLISAFLGLYGLAILDDPRARCPARRRRRGLRPVRGRERAPGRDGGGRRRSLRRDERARSWRGRPARARPASTITTPPSGSASRSTARSGP